MEHQVETLRLQLRHQEVMHTSAKEQYERRIEDMNARHDREVEMMRARASEDYRNLTEKCESTLREIQETH